jgi:hypothetical protein
MEHGTAPAGAPAPPASLSHPPREKVNVPWVVGSWAIGAALIGLAFAVEKFYEWQGASVETLISVGSAFLLAGVLFFIQRRFIFQVTTATSQAVATAVDARFDERVEAVDTRLDQLDERMTELLTERNKRQDETVEALDHPSFATLAEALATANGLGALAFDRVTVQASSSLDGVGLEFSWGMEASVGGVGIHSGPALRVKGTIYADQNSNARRPLIQTTWLPGESVESVGLRLHEQIERGGRWKGEGSFDWALALHNLQRSLDVAVRSQRHDSSDWIVEGALFELVGDDWAITMYGLECPERGYKLSESTFPSRPFPSPRSNPVREDYEAWSPQKPEWVEPELWELLVRRGKQHFPISHAPAIMTPSWFPLPQGPRELGLLDADPE